MYTYVLHGIKTYFKYNLRRYKKLNVLLSSSCVQGCMYVNLFFVYRYLYPGYRTCTIFWGEGGATNFM